jgi:hypothetical protein
LRTAFHSEARRYRGEYIAFTCLFLCVRALVEIPGLFGYGQDVTDYLAYVFVAVVASRMSLLQPAYPNPRPSRITMAKPFPVLTSLPLGTR